MAAAPCCRAACPAAEHRHRRLHRRRSRHPTSSAIAGSLPRISSTTSSSRLSYPLPDTTAASKFHPNIAGLPTRRERLVAKRDRGSHRGRCGDRADDRRPGRDPAPVAEREPHTGRGGWREVNTAASGRRSTVDAAAMSNARLVAGRSSRHATQALERDQDRRWLRAPPTPSTVRSTSTPGSASTRRTGPIGISGDAATAAMTAERRRRTSRRAWR